ncbi:SMC-Scp complex subunit ScpB [Kribbella qitaiheensis]|uniref:SMC-Scp complex subunit ScpB n=1 Tax=Kribbella qitaiheensis TaxID=1544730 RepID=UPI001FE35297|nr:SMC-Scp complex subunit ScpB [Kribbella qitaiheensis]
MTENQTTTDLDTSPEVETEEGAVETPDAGSAVEGADAATADALESVTGTEQVVDREPEPDIAVDDAAASAVAEGEGEVDPASAVAEDEGDEIDLASASVVAEGEGAPFGDDEGVLSGAEVVVDDATMRRALEAILMVTDEPLPALALARTVGRPTGDVANALNELAGEYTEQGRGFDLREVGGGWRFYTRADTAQYVERFVLDGQQSRLTQAALETLAVVSYKQPVSRARVSAIRGVNVDGVMRTLISRGLVEEAGSDTESQATLYRTTSYFLERMGMQSLDDLPELAPYLPDMDDMEEELAAQNAQAPAEGESAEAAEPTEASAPTGASAPTEASAPTDASEATDSEAEIDEADTASAIVDDAEESDLPGDEVVQSGVGEWVAEDAGDGEELESAEELEAGGDEIGTDVDPAEIPSVEEDADGNDEEGGPADSDAAEGDSAESDDTASDGESDTAEVTNDEAEDAVDGFDEDDESADERLEAAEELEAAGAPSGFDGDGESVGGTSQYGTEANDRDE